MSWKKICQISSVFSRRKKKYFFYLEAEKELLFSIKAEKKEHEEKKSAADKKDKEAMNLKFKKWWLKAMIDLNLDSSLMVKSLVTMKILNALSSWTLVQQISFLTRLNSLPLIELIATPFNYLTLKGLKL